MSVADEIEKLNALWKSGALSEEEYQKAKQSLLEKQDSFDEKFSKAVGDISSNENMWAMFIHLSQLCGYLVPLAGLIVPIVLWQVKKNESRIIDQHGRIVANWIITACIFGLVFLVLSFVIIGIPLLLILGVLSIVFPIVGGIKANNGELWPYPLCIKFFALD